jgi:starch synthase
VGLAARASPTGFVFDEATHTALERAVLRAVALHKDPVAWKARIAAAMAQPLSWNGPAQTYLDLYAEVVREKALVREKSLVR